MALIRDRRSELERNCRADSLLKDTLKKWRSYQTYPDELLNPVFHPSQMGTLSRFLTRRMPLVEINEVNEITTPPVSYEMGLASIGIDAMIQDLIRDRNIERFLGKRIVIPLKQLCLLRVIELGRLKDLPDIIYESDLKNLSKCPCGNIITHINPRCPEGCRGCEDKYCTAKFGQRFTEKAIFAKMRYSFVCRGCSLERLNLTHQSR